MSKYPAGFTVVELITTIILLAILSGVAMSTMVSSSSFAPSTVAHQFNLELNFAHAAATARQDVAVSLEILADADAWLIRTSNSVDGVIRTTSVEAFNSNITATSGASSSLLSASDTLVINYAGTGEIASASLAGSVIHPADGIQLLLIGDSSRTLCIYPSGYFDHDVCR